MEKKYKYDAVIFDMDGTIVNTESIWHNAAQSLLTRRGIVLDPEKEQTLFKQTQGLALHKSVFLIKQAGQLPESVEELITEKSQYAHELYEQGITFIDGFQLFHQKLVQYKLKTAIATNATADTTTLTDQILNLQQFFGKHIYNVTHVDYVNKPDPALYFHAAKQLNIEPTRCIAIEDSINGVKAAKQAGMYCIGINTAKKPELLQEADCIVNGYDNIALEELLEIKQSNNKNVLRTHQSLRP